MRLARVRFERKASGNVIQENIVIYPVFLVMTQKELNEYPASYQDEKAFGLAYEHGHEREVEILVKNEEEYRKQTNEYFHDLRHWCLEL
jgi:hypothetical protein